MFTFVVPLSFAETIMSFAEIKELYGKKKALEIEGLLL
jgi:hypothetical protein